MEKHFFGKNIFYSLVGFYFPAAECLFHRFSCPCFLYFQWHQVPYANAVGDWGYVLESFEAEVNISEKFLMLIAFFVEYMNLFIDKENLITISINDIGHVTAGFPLFLPDSTVG